MTSWQKLIAVMFAVFNFLIFLKSLNETVKKRNAYGLAGYLFFIGIFVWGDAIIISPFWVVASCFSIFLNNWYLFLLFISVFWTVRSLGETIYWFNQQFSTINRNQPEKLRGYCFFKNDSIWFIYQLVYQCLTVTSIITTIYLVNRWLIVNGT